MNGPEAVFWWLCFVIASFGFVRTDDKVESKGANETLQLNISRGVQLYVANEETRVIVRMSTLLERNEIGQRSTGRLKFNDTLKRIGMAMMMAPMIIQLMSLPGTLASIKFSLLRSIFVGKLALLLILWNIFKNTQRSEVVLVHKPEYHEHYYDNYHHKPDEDEGWLGR
ncbi:uncharacterized protein LOC122403108 [Colletes gigas]|uniref:uncharacterized protein LOC122403108 n=1 Tax=Colletes gigas TaxID=935657 RepID=UPI001C9A93A3|nr:uncharacterized protein LOC122403108 [Colletes gigas]